MIRRFLLVAVSFLSFLAAAPFPAAIAFAQAPDEVAFGTGEVTIETAQGPHVFTVELAQTPPQRARGLMFRRALDAGRGMLFLYPREQQVLMWMKDTYIPLDMLFIDGQGRIARIVENAVPLSTDLIPSGSAVRWVLELAGGTAARLKIREGDSVGHLAILREGAPR